MKSKLSIMLLPNMLFLMCLQIMSQPLAGGAAFSPQAEAPVEPERFKAEHQRVLEELSVRDENGRLMDLDDPRVPALLREGWNLAGAWAAAYIDSHPSLSKTELEHIFNGFAPQSGAGYSFEGSARQVGSSIYVVTASYTGSDFPTGTFMVVARNHAGHFQALWNIKDLAEKHYPQRDEIGRWAHLVRRAYHNGPLDVEDVVPLSTAANGHTRFLVKAFQGADGTTALAQLSIWEWDGAEAKPLLVQSYLYALPDDREFRIHHGAIRLMTKEEDKLGALFTSGPSDEPRAVWRIRVTPAGVLDLGRQFLKPEIKWADELLSRVAKEEHTSNLASASVVKAVNRRIAERRAELKSDTAGQSDTADQEDTPFVWAMLEGCRVLRRGQRGVFVLVTDDEQIRFTYVQRRGKPYFTHVRFTPTV